MRKGASKLDIPPLSNSVLISTDPKTSILLSNKIKQLIHIKSKLWKEKGSRGRGRAGEARVCRRCVYCLGVYRMHYTHQKLREKYEGGKKLRFI